VPDSENTLPELAANPGRMGGAEIVTVVKAKRLLMLALREAEIRKSKRGGSQSTRDCGAALAMLGKTENGPWMRGEVGRSAFIDATIKKSPSRSRLKKERGKGKVPTQTACNCARCAGYLVGRKKKKVQ